MLIQIKTGKQKRLHDKQRGYTLVEVMIVVVIVGILAAVGYPGFQNYLLRAKRAEARNMLVQIAAQEERYYSNNNRYGTLANLGYGGTVTSENGHYTMTVDSIPASGQIFRVIATPSGFSDPKCNVLTLTNTGLKEFTGNADLEVCWAK